MHPPGAIIVPNTGLLRHTQFVADLFQLEKPEGTVISWPQGGSVVQNLNRSLRALMNVELEWAWFQADDHCFDKQILRGLLDRNLDVVVPLIVSRKRLHELVIGTESTEIDPDNGREYPAYQPIGLDEFPSQEEPFPVEIAGTAGMLVRRHVLEAIGYPYLETTDGLKLNEDIVFSKKVRDAGFQIYADPKARMGHLTPLPVWPA